MDDLADDGQLNNSVPEEKEDDEDKQDQPNRAMRFLVGYDDCIGSNINKINFDKRQQLLYNYNR